MSQVHVPGGSIAPQAAARPRLRSAEIVEGAVIVILLVATIVFGYQWNQTQASLSRAQASAATQAEVAAYGGAYLPGIETLHTAVVALNSAMATGDAAATATAVAEVRSSLSLLSVHGAALTAPAAVTPAQNEFVQGNYLVAAGADMMDTALASSDAAGLYEAKAMIDQGWSHFETGRSWIYTALRSAG